MESEFEITLGQEGSSKSRLIYLLNQDKDDNSGEGENR